MNVFGTIVKIIIGTRFMCLSASLPITVFVSHNLYLRVYCTLFPLPFTTSVHKYLDIDVSIDTGRFLKGGLSEAWGPQANTVDLARGGAEQPFSLGSAG